MSAICVEDGTVEAIEFLNCNFAVGLKFHAEIEQNSLVDRIFKGFVLACSL